MGQNSEIGESSYVKITTQASEKEKIQLHYEAVSGNEVDANKKNERRFFIYQVILVAGLITLALVKESFFPSHIGWIDWIINKF